MTNLEKAIKLAKEAVVINCNTAAEYYDAEYTKIGDICGEFLYGDDDDENMEFFNSVCDAVGL